MACSRVNFTFDLTFTPQDVTLPALSLHNVPTSREYFQCIQNTITIPSFISHVECYVQTVTTSTGSFVLPYALNLSSQRINRVSCANVVKGERSLFPYLYPRRRDIKLFLRPWFPPHRQHKVFITKNNHINVGRFLCKLYGISVTSDQNRTVPTKRKTVTILAHPVYKMWIIQEPNTLELWNKLHFEEKKTESIYHV